MSPDGGVLLRLARHAVECSLLGRAPEIPDLPWLAQPAATFVTITRHGDLRGCIGTTEPRRSLGEDIVAHAQAAAFRDPRMKPVTLAELPELHFEVSLLSEPTPLAADSRAEALAAISPGVDGLVFESDTGRSVFLPQVWETLREPERFLAQLLRKAGLPPEGWGPDYRLSRFTVEKWREEEQR